MIQAVPRKQSRSVRRTRVFGFIVGFWTFGLIALDRYYHVFPLQSQPVAWGFVPKSTVASKNLLEYHEAPSFSHRRILEKTNPFQPITANSMSLQTDSNDLDIIISIDPLVAAVFEDIREDESDATNERLMESLRSIQSGILQTSRGIAMWRIALAKGQLPVEADFAPERSESVWPPPPLFSYLVEAASTLQLQRLALRHPDTIPMILRSILRQTFEYARRRTEEVTTDETIDDDDDEDSASHSVDPYFYDWNDEERIEVSTFSSGSLMDDKDIAREVVDSLVEEWKDVADGVSILDDIFGLEHDLLSTGEEDEDDGNEDGGTAGAAMGFGMRDGIWSHSGWSVVPALQEQMADIPELKTLMQTIGRRPSAEEDAENRRKFEKFAPRKRHPDGGLGAEFDPHLRRESVTGIALSGNPSEMLPSEAVLLRQRLGVDEKTSSPSVLRRLFMAKMAESKLQSYELSGWADVPSVPRTRPLYLNRLPSAPGGPIMVCLDTSWSMSGNREMLSKAVVLACVMEARKQGRDCQIVAFSTERKLMESGIISPNVDGIRRLLEFLSHSFGGGTDVTGALKFAIAALEGSNSKDTNSEYHSYRNRFEQDVAMEAADILLVTDGEIPDPPVPPDVMASIDRLKSMKGVELHGLLVGKSESKPLSRICTDTHDFLSKHTMPIGIVKDRTGIENPRTSILRPKGRMSSTQLFAKRSYYDDDDGGYSNKGRGKKRKKGKKKKWDSYDDEDDNEYENTWGEMFDEEEVEEMDNATDDDERIESTRAALDILQRAAAESVENSLWKATMLDDERASSNGCWDSHLELRAAVARVEDGLIERGEDARLVVLAMIANEHILLLGKPGTGKSVLGLRLAKLCEGTFFQRLLTRFTTPEELFGPLSLRSLENDEYRRVTAGFLPTADIAFLDEIFKANSAILNTLLTILNERKFDNGGAREPCPIRCVVGASNELPDSEELVALYDRFLLRKEVVKVSDQGVIDLLSMSNPGESSCMKSTQACEIPDVEDLDGIIQRLSAAADFVVMDTDCCELIRDMRSHLLEHHEIEISDRRLVKAARLLKISASSDGRTKVDTVDFLILQHCFWNEPSERVAIREWLWDNLTPSDRDSGISPNQIRFLLDNLRTEIVGALQKTNGCIDSSLGAKAGDIAALETFRKEAEGIAAIARKRLDALARHQELVRQSDEFLWIDPDDARTMQQVLLPRAEMLWPQLKKVTEDAVALAVAISPKSSIENEDRIGAIEGLWEDGSTLTRDFTEDELQLTSKDAKAKFDLETFRRWKRAKKKASK